MPHDNGSVVRRRGWLPFSTRAGGLPSRTVTHVVRERARVSRLSRGVGLLAALAVGLPGCATTTVRRPPSQADSIAAVVRFEGINEDYWRFLQFSRPEVGARAGAVVTTLPDPTQDQAKKDAQFARAALVALDEVLVEALPQDSYVSWLSLRWEMEALAGWPAFHWTRLNDVAPGQSVFDVAIEILRAQRIADPGAGQRFLALVTSVRDLARDVRLEYAERVRRGIRLPRESVNRAAAHIRELNVPADASPFGLPPDFEIPSDSGWQQRLARDVAGVIVGGVNPSLDSLAAFLEGERDGATDAIGMLNLPGGAAHYATLLRYRSTLEITPEDAHAIGLREVARLVSLAAAARREAGLPVNRDSLRTRLAMDSAFVVRDAGTITATAAMLYEEAVAALDTLFQPMPKTMLAIGIQPEVESSSPLATYVGPTTIRPRATYRMNAVKLAARSGLILPALILGDLMPGLHHQRATQFENLGLPQFRRHSFHDGFVKGWQVYSLHVADSLSGSLTATQRFGVRLRELAAACGLVVDTGINALGWSRDDALAFLRAYLLRDDADLVEEFIVEAIESPGALSAAALGARELRGLRHWAMRELGDRFSLREFHAELLRIGSVPLPVLGSHLERWMWEQNRPTPPGGGGRR